MSWFSTIVSAVLTAVAGTVLTGYVANLAVRWYRISSFEGGSGYYVVFLALAGGIAALIIGIIVARIVAAGANPAFVKALAFSLLTITALTGAGGSVARLMADVPPTVDGEELMLVVEARWPAGTAQSPAATPGTSFLELGSNTSAHVERLAKRGALWKEDARLVDGRWTVTGVAPVFTERGARSVNIALNDSTRYDFLIDLPRRPGTRDFEFSEWLPTEGAGGTIRDTGISIRYRVQKRSEPTRTETVGPFEVSASIAAFMPDAHTGMTTLDGPATFRVRHGGRLVAYAGESGAAPTTNATVRMLAQLSQSPLALVALVTPANGFTQCALLVDEQGTLREQRIAPCDYTINAEPLTNDSAEFVRLKKKSPAQGRVDRASFIASDMLLFTNAVLDVRALSVRTFAARGTASINENVPPLGLSPDRSSFVRFGYSQNGGGPSVLVVTDFVQDVTYEVPIDRTRMRYAELDELDPAWLAHHFEWQHASGPHDRLVARAHYAPIPYHGVVRVDDAGVHRIRFSSGGHKLRTALVAMLATEFGAEHGALSDDTYDQHITIGGRTFAIGTPGDDGYVLVAVASDVPDNALIDRIATRVNALLSTGTYDALFVP